MITKMAYNTIGVKMIKQTNCIHALCTCVQARHIEVKTLTDLSGVMTHTVPVQKPPH